MQRQNTKMKTLLRVKLFQIDMNHLLRCWGKLSLVEGRFSKCFLSAKKGVLNLFSSISMAYNVISCQKVAENTQILNIAKFAM